MVQFLARKGLLLGSGNGSESLGLGLVLGSMGWSPAVVMMVQYCAGAICECYAVVAAPAAIVTRGDRRIAYL